MSAIWLSFRDDITPFSYIAICIKYLFFSPPMFTGFVIKHITCCNFHYWLRQFFPFGKDKMNMIICLSFIVMKCRYTFHAILFLEIISKLFQHFIGFQILIFFRQSYNQCPCFDTLPCTATTLKITLILFCQLFSEAIITSPIYAIQILLPIRTCNIIYLSCHVRQPLHSYK